jgi:hypothetical protein
VELSALEVDGASGASADASPLAASGVASAPAAASAPTVTGAGAPTSALHAAAAQRTAARETANVLVDIESRRMARRRAMHRARRGVPRKGRSVTRRRTPDAGASAYRVVTYALQDGG